VNAPVHPVHFLWLNFAPSSETATPCYAPNEAVDLTLPVNAHRKIAIIAALDRELYPLVRHWPTTELQHEGRDFTFYESDFAVAVCGGIGFEAARRAAQAVIVSYHPELLISAGVAGALVPELGVGETIFPATVIDAGDGSRHDTAIRNARIGNSPLARTVLVSSADIAGAPQKQKLGKAYGAHAIDMEAAAVARAAQVHGLPFLVVKSISDEVDFELPDVAPFIKDGQLQTGRFAVHVAFRPWLWLRVLSLARNTRIASENLCAWLRESVLTNTIVPESLGTGGGARGSDVH
jgi:adenosylhomocysteine nucleosidase